MPDVTLFKGEEHYLVSKKFVEFSELYWGPVKPRKSSVPDFGPGIHWNHRDVGDFIAFTGEDFKV